MIYQSTITVDKNTSSSTPKITQMKLTRGLLYKIEIYFPPGSSGLLGCRVLDKGVQIYPSVRNEWFFGNNIQIEFDDTYLLTVPPFVFDLYSYNDDTYYDHVFVVRVGFLSRDDMILRYLPKDTEALIEKYVSEQSTKSAEQRAADIDFLRGIL